MLGNNIKMLRIKKGFSQAQLGKFLSVTQQAVGKWEKNIAEPDTQTIQKLSELFDVTTDYLLGRTDYPYNLPNNAKPVGDFIKLPIIGTIRAGYDGLAVEEDTGEVVEVPRELLQRYDIKDLFALRVKGNSMYPKIEMGDTVLVYRTISVDPGSIAVILYNGDEATIKKVNYVNGEDWLELIPHNPEYATKRIDGAELEQCRILGKVIYLFRKF